jgi:fructokinase
VRLSQLGLPAFLVSAVGEDNAGRDIIKELSELGVDTRHVQCNSQKTGRVEVTLSDDKNPRFVIEQDVAYDYIRPEVELEALLSSCSVLVFGTLAQRSPQTASTLFWLMERAPQATKVLDVNLRKDCYSAESIKKSLEATDIVKLNETELLILSDLLKISSDRGHHNFLKLLNEQFSLQGSILTRGEKGVFCLTKENQEIVVPAKSISVVDTIGAGDAFTAGLASGLYHKFSLERCCMIGNEMGAAAAQSEGGTGRLPKDFDIPALFEKVD